MFKFARNKKCNGTIDDIELKDIYVGKADGLKEAQDDNFENYFYKGNNKYQELDSDSRKFIISGKKGTGKTILAKYFELEENKKGHPTKFLTERDAKLRQFMELGKLIENSDEIDLFVEYSIYCELGRVVLNNKKAIILKSGIHINRVTKYIKYLDKIINNRTSIENYFKDKYSKNTIKSEQTEMSANKKMDDDSIMGSAKYSKSSAIEASYVKNPYYNILDEIRKAVQYLLRFICINLIYDDLDEYDEIIVGNEKFIAFFNSFIKVANRVNSDIYINNHEYSRIILLIRSDMLTPLNNHSKNLAKIIADGQIKLNWMKKEYKTSNKNDIHPLIEMVLIKIKNSNELLREMTNDEILRRFFPKYIDGVKLSSYLLNLSFGRPRDIINMLNVIREEMPNATRFYKNAFINTKYDYSEKFVIELRNELSSYYRSEEIDECFDIIRKIGKKEFWLSDINNVFESNSIKYFANPEEFYSMCYEYGILGNITVYQTIHESDMNKVDSVGKMKRSFSWKFREDGNLKPDPSKKFCVHMALKKLLD